MLYINEKNVLKKLIVLSALIFSLSIPAFAGHTPKHLEEESEKIEKLLIVAGAAAVVLLLFSYSKKKNYDKNNHFFIAPEKTKSVEYKPFISLYDTGVSDAGQYQGDFKNTGISIGLSIDY